MGYATTWAWYRSRSVADFIRPAPTFPAVVLFAMLLASDAS